MKYFPNAKSNLSLLLLYLLTFVLFISHPADLDLGWHLKYGEYAWQHQQVLRTNIFSTTLPAYRWINSTTGTDILSYALYRIGGFQALSLGGAGLSLIALLLFSKAAGLNALQQFLIYPIFVYVSQPYWLVSFRGQLISLAFLGVLSRVLRLGEKNQKILVIIPLLFMLWANIHGQVIIGLIVLSVWTISQLFLHTNSFKKHITRYSILVFSAFAACVFNPFGYTIFLEFRKYIGNPIMSNIGEWVPLDTFSLYWWQLMGMAFFTIIGILFLVYKRKTKQYWVWMVIALLFLGLSILQRRYGIMFYCFSFLILSEILPRSIPSTKINTNKFKLLLQCFILFAIIGLGINRITELKTMSWNTYCTTLGCPTQAAQFLSTHQWELPILTYYDWGGWLIWNYPHIPPSIDGRMPLWEDETGESPYSRYSAYMTQSIDIDASPYNTVFIPQTLPIYNRLLDLERLGRWLTIYEDNVATIFIRVR